MKLRIVTLLTMLATQALHAEGLAGKQTQTGFQELLSYVAEDTPYLLANQRTVPKAIVDQQLAQQKALYTVLPELQTGSATAEKKEEVFFYVLQKGFYTHLAENTLEKIGLTVEAHVVLYGFQGLPVLRWGIADKAKFVAFIQQAEKDSGYTVGFKKCGQHDCVKGKFFTLVVQDTHLAVALSPDGVSVEALLAHLQGAKPEKPYPQKRWQAFLHTNQYSGFGDGFIDFEKLRQHFNPLIEATLGKACNAVLADHLNYVPQLTIGSKKFTAKKVRYEMVFHTLKPASEALQTLAGSQGVGQRLAKPSFDLGVNINANALREALLQYVKFLTASAQTHQCKQIDPAKINNSVQSAMLGITMGLGQIGSMYLGLDDFTINPKTSQPEKITAYAAVGAKDPSGVLAMVQAMVPPLRDLQIPDDGSMVVVPKELIPASPAMPALSEMKIGKTKQEVQLQLGAASVLAAYQPKITPLFFIGMDYQKYMQALSFLLTKDPSATKAEKTEMQKIADAMQQIKGMIQETIYADARGLVIDVEVDY